MKSDRSIRNITVAAIKRSARDIESWKYSKISLTDKLDICEPLENEVPIFEIESNFAKTIFTTQRIIELKSQELKWVNVTEIKNVQYDLNIKRNLEKPELLVFRVINIKGETYDFQMESGKASMGVMRCLDTVKKLTASS